MSTPSERNASIDALKVALTGAVIVTHCALTYGANGSWFYHEAADGAFGSVVGLPIAFGALFAMGCFFFLAGCYVPGSLARKGARRFASGRLLRLGVPWLVVVVAVVPVIEFAVAAVAGPPQTLGAVLRGQARRLDAGPLWFVAVLLLFSLGWAGIHATRPARVRTDRPMSLAAVTGAAATVAGTSFVLRISFPIDSFQIGSLHVWQWGQCLTLFVLGVRCGEHGLAPASTAVRRASRIALAAGLLATVGLLAEFRDDLDRLGGGFGWPSALVATVEGAVSVSATVLLVDVVGRRRARVRPAWLARAAFPAYTVQAPVIVGYGLALRAAAIPPTVKFALLAAASLLTCFAVGSLSTRNADHRRATAPSESGNPTLRGTRSRTARADRPVPQPTSRDAHCSDTQPVGASSVLGPFSRRGGRWTVPGS